MKKSVLDPHSPSLSSPARLCTHCGLPVPAFRSEVRSAEEAVFCCDGCRTVYQIITGHQLQEYYAIKNKSEFFARRQPVSSVHSRYGYLDEPEIEKKFAYGEGGRCMNFYVEGVHCVACLWLIERIGKVVPGVRQVRMNLGDLTARVTLDSGGRFSGVAEGLEKIGYRPHPVPPGSRAEGVSRDENRRDMTRVGVAGFFMMNIMILFISIYAGASETVLQLFRWLSGLLFLPVALYAALPFYRGALSALRMREINIDLPVAGALVLGSAASVWNLIAGSEHIYFDSLSAFVFLLLSARYALKTLYQKAGVQLAGGEFLIPKSALRVDPENGKTEVRAVEGLRPGDLILVPQGEVIAADGEVEKGTGYADFHMISGEAAPVKLNAGARVFAGAVNVGEDLWVRVTAVGRLTRIERLLESVQNLEKPRIVEMADSAARRYLAAVFLGAVALLVTGSRLSFSQAFDRALSMIIIACPCALALATPLVYRMGARACARSGILLKGVSALDKLARARKLFIDKTGTLTYGRYQVLEWKIETGRDDFRNLAFVLEKESSHPIALAIREHVLSRIETPGAGIQLDNFSEALGRGVSGTWCGRFYEIRGVRSAAEVRMRDQAVLSSVGIFEDGVLKVRIELGDRIREDSAAAVEKLSARFESVEMLTGDRSESAAAIASLTGLHAFTAEMTPEEKKDRLASEPFSLMVGDGANDAAAMKAADVSVAVQGSIETSFQSADVYLTVPGIGTLPELAAIARRTRKVVWAALLASLAYNLTGMVLAVLGQVTPLVAAIVMPVSSLTVLIIAYAGLCFRRAA